MANVPAAACQSVMLGSQATRALAALLGPTVQQEATDTTYVYHYLPNLHKANP